MASDDEIQVLVRLQGEDKKIFEAVKKKTKIQIHAEILRVTLRQYYEDRILNTPESTLKPGH